MERSLYVSRTLLGEGGLGVWFLMLCKLSPAGSPLGYVSKTTVGIPTPPWLRTGPCRTTEGPFPACMHADLYLDDWDPFGRACGLGC